MDHKLSLNVKVPTGTADEEMFLETSAADLFYRWHKEIRLFSRKSRSSHQLKDSVSQKN